MGDNNRRNGNKNNHGEIAAATSSPPENVPLWKAILSRLSTFSVYRLFLALIAFVVVGNLFTYQYVPPIVTQLFSLIPWEANHPDRPVLPVDLPPRNTTPKSGTTPGTFGLALSDVRVTSFFVFGDSTVDAGNFNLMTHPYGVDLPLPRILTPRFTNGHTIADLFAMRWGIPIPQPYRSLGPDQLMDSAVNINFATGGCGLLTSTKPPFNIPCTPMFDQVLQLVMARRGNSDPEEAIYLISAGANDFVFSYDGTDPQKFAEDLVHQMENFMKLLVTCGGAKNFLINNLGPVGCIPEKMYSTGKCNNELNEAVLLYNSKLVTALKEFSSFGASVVLADSASMFSEMVKNPDKHGLKNVAHPCCGEWNEYLEKYDCKNDTNLCPVRDDFLFFDGAHFTEKANEVFVDYCLEGKVCYPLK